MKMLRVSAPLRCSIFRLGAHLCWVIGDSAPYGVYCPIEQWIGELALAAGFVSYRFEKLRDRNIKWKIANTVFHFKKVCYGLRDDHG
jgi:hypothetical protein